MNSLPVVRDACEGKDRREASQLPSPTLSIRENSGTRLFRHIVLAHFAQTGFIQSGFDRARGAEEGGLLCLFSLRDIPRF